jgi:CRP-like cAMP-binding protein
MDFGLSLNFVVNAAFSAGVVVLTQGTADVTLHDRPVAKVMSGEFVGEIAFLAERPATATVKAAEDGRAMVWGINGDVLD